MVVILVQVFVLPACMYVSSTEDFNAITFFVKKAEAEQRKSKDFKVQIIFCHFVTPYSILPDERD